ncbi:MAG TPA: PAS domain-containing protein, partial [Terriglobales bacterium]|nr:PAS domain-containing protein [Terriglobales bacterium]
YGWPAAEALGKIIHELLRTEFPSPLDILEASLHQKREWNGELKHTCRDDKRIVVASRWSLLRDQQGTPTSIMEINRDISQRKQAETALQYSEKRYRSLVVASSQIVWTTNANGEVCGDMPMWREFTGQTFDQIQGWGWIDSLHPEDRERTAAVWTQAVKNRTLYDTDYRMRRCDGEYRFVTVRGVPIIEADGHIREWIGTCTDVTERAKAQEQLRLSQERLALAQKAGRSGSFDWDIQKNVNIWSPEVEELYGLPAGGFGGTFESWEQLVFPEDLPIAQQAIEQSLKSGKFAGEWRIRRPDNGEIRWIHARAKVFFDQKGRPSRMVGINMDITERKQAEEEIRKLNNELEQRVLQRTAQLEASNKELEAFTYSVSHDLRAPLRHVAAFAKMLLEEYQAKLDDNAQHYLQRISEGVQRMCQLVDDLLNLARVGRKELGLQVTGLNSIVQEVIEELQPEAEARQVEWKVGTLPFVECDPALMKQVFQNLLSNALKFTRPRAQAVIEVAQGQDKAQNLIFVRDNGVGFSMKYADKLFGVFQRLHRAEDFEGTGVGLATVQRIIAKHGGRIWAEAELDKGATFYFTLGSAEIHAEKTQIAVAGAQS